MGFEARTEQEILEGLVARTIQRSKLSDVAPGSTFLHLHQVVAEEGAIVEQRMAAIRASFDEHDENATGTDVDDRAEEFPRDFERRLQRAAASGPALAFHRTDTAGERTIEAGVICGRDDVRSLVYVTSHAFTFGDGEATYPASSSDPYVRVTCNQLGSVGKAPAGKITTILSQVSDLIVTQPVAVGGGRDREETDELLRRMDAHRDGNQPGLGGDLVNLALQFRASDGTRCRYASIWESPFQPAYAELVVDDGYGFVGLTRAGSPISGTVPANGQHLIAHESPATEPFTALTVDGSPVSVEAVGWASQPERGFIYFPPDYLTPGVTWSLPAYNVFTGFIGELQALIEGHPSLNGTQPGRRNNGTRLRVVPATVTYLSLEIRIQVAPGGDPPTVRALVKAAVVDFLASLAPGQRLVLSDLTARLVKIPYLFSHRIVTPSDDYQPESSRHRLATTPDMVDVQ